MLGNIWVHWHVSFNQLALQLDFHNNEIDNGRQNNSEKQKAGCKYKQWTPSPLIEGWQFQRCDFCANKPVVGLCTQQSTKDKLWSPLLTVLDKTNTKWIPTTLELSRLLIWYNFNKAGFTALPKLVWVDHCFAFGWQSTGWRNYLLNVAQTGHKKQWNHPFPPKKGNTLKGESWVSVCKALALQKHS